MSEIIVVMVTAGNEEEAVRMARALVVERLAACASIVPQIRSIYRWKGEVHDEAELLIILKTRKDLFAALEARVRALHSYEVPEIVGFTLALGASDYLAWVLANTGAAT
jgi:periplasmic divalent cation tolerance protein